MRAHLRNLIKRMTRSEPTVMNSADSVSWHAYREAENIDEPSVIEELDAYLREKPAKADRAAAYFIIGKVGKNLQSAECASVLIAHIGSESDKYALAALFDGLGEIPKRANENLAPVYRLLQDKRWLVRHAAIGSLRNASSSEAEHRILEVLRDTGDPGDTICCHVTLNGIGTAKALPALQAGLKSRKRDVKLSAEAAIDAILSRIAA